MHVNPWRKWEKWWSHSYWHKYYPDTLILSLFWGGGVKWISTNSSLHPFSLEINSFLIFWFTGCHFWCTNNSLNLVSRLLELFPSLKFYHWNLMQENQNNYLYLHLLSSCVYHLGTCNYSLPIPILNTFKSILYTYVRLIC